jgi:P27 family predicted phage terminase small subunit
MLQLVSVDKLDTEALGNYCENEALIRHLRQIVATEGSTYETETKNGVMQRQRPEQQQIIQLQGIQRSLRAELGLTPASRVRVPDPNQGALFERDAPGWDSF